MKYKLISHLIIIICLSIFITGCSYGQIEDTNGDEDFSIETISDEKIKKGPNTRFVIKSKRTNKNNISTVKIEKFSGIYLLKTTKVSNQTLTFNIDSTVEKGNFRIVIVKDKEIIKDFLINCSDSHTIDNAVGNYLLKIVGESAKFTIDFEICKINN